MRRYKPPLRPTKRSARDSILAQWRGVDVGPIQKGGLKAKSAGDLVPRLLKELRIDRRQWEAEVVKVWNESLDPQIVRHAQPTGLRNGTLFVTVDSNVWLAELVRYRRKEILERLQYSFGKDLIARISFRCA